MKLKEVIDILDGEVLCGKENLEINISSVCAGDLMSDLLACPQSHGLLITGLVNVQVIRTAEMLDLAAVVFIRGKHPTGEMLDLAREKKITLISTKNPLYTSCGLLYEAGFRACPLY